MQKACNTVLDKNHDKLEILYFNTLLCFSNKFGCVYVKLIEFSFLYIKLVLRIVSTQKNFPAVYDMESYARLYNMDCCCIGLRIVEWL